MKARMGLFFIFLIKLALADNYPRNEAIDIRHYTFKLELNDTTNIIAGEASIQVLIKKPIAAFELDLVNQNMQQHGMRVSSVLLNASEVTFEHQNNRLKISFPKTTLINGLHTFTVRYSGIPIDGLIISNNRYGDRTFFGDNWPDRARNWLPTIDHPYDKAGVDFVVTAPVHYSVIGNGVKLEESYLNEKQKLTHWHEEVDIPTKVMVIGVARFAIQHVATVNNIPVESWVYPQNRSEGFSDYAPAVRIIEFFSKHVGPYSYKKLANVQSTTRYGGMENASNIFYYEKSVTGKGEINNLIAHEIAHQWFGNSASENDWHHVWLSEGFATYFTHVYNEFTYGKESAITRLQKDRNRVIDYSKKAPAPVINTSITNYADLLTPHVYDRGGWVLHMLRNEIGDEPFWQGIREYYRSYQNSNALSSDLQRVMEQVSNKKLDTFFHQWLTRAEIPALKMMWTYQNKNLVLTIDQLQPGDPFDFPLQVAFDEGKNRTIETVRINQKRQKISIPASTKPKNVTLDPETKLLFEEISKN
jgi:aminopeptidase N